MSASVACKTFEARSGAALEHDFNGWFEAMNTSVTGFVIVQSHLTQIERGVMLVVFWTPAPIIERGATQ